MNMNKYIKFEIISTICVMCLGVLLHFTYELSNKNFIISLFSSTNESVWEHLKLLFFPYFLFILIGHTIFKSEYPNYINFKTLGLLTGLFFIVIFYYTYTGIIGKNFAFIDISSFFIAVIISQVTAFKNKSNLNFKPVYSIVFLLILTCLFLIFTFFPPNIGLFQ